ncbi:MAG: site-specific integrase, partial [Oscillospiraceae bacterium]
MANSKQKVYSDYSQCPPVLKEFLYYMQTIKGLSPKTVEAYFIDLQLFFKYMVQKRNGTIDNELINEVKIDNIDLEFLSQIKQMDILDFLYFITDKRENSVAARSRKISSLRNYFRYMTTKTSQLSVNPTENIEM